MTLTPNERRSSLASQHPLWQPRTISQALDHASSIYADRPLVFSGERIYSYRDIQNWSRQIAAGLLASGVKPGDHIALVLGNYPEFVAVKFAISRVGAVAVPINYLLRHSEMNYVLSQSDSTMLITMNSMRDRNYLEDLDQIIPGWETKGGGGNLPKLREVVVLTYEGSKRSNALSLEALIARGNSTDALDLAKIETAGVPDSCSDIVYTSGTTGHPKGVMLSHEMILRAAYASAYTRAFEDGRRIQFALPMYHVFGYVECLMACLFAGGSIIPHALFDPEQMVEAGEKLNPSEIVCVPVMTLKILDIARVRGYNNPNLIAFFNSGGDSPPSIWQDIRTLLGAREVLTAYGMSETTASTTCTLPEEGDEHLLNTNGKLKYAGVAGDGCQNGILAIYKTVDPETGKDLPFGQSGELMAYGPVVTKGYYNKPEETSLAFDSNGWLHTGDLGTISADGYLKLTGRIKEAYRCGGEMVMPQEIEALLLQHPLIDQVSVVGITDLKMGEIGCACIVTKGNEQPDPQELIDLCSERLARFKVPRHIVFLSAEEFPRTSTGKIQKFRLAQIVKQRLSAN